MTKACVFDLGNVVLTSDYPYNTPAEARDFCDYFGVTLDNASLAFTIAFHDFSLGKCSEDEFWTNYLYTARAKKTDIAYAKSFWRKNQKENEHMVSLLTQLKKHIAWRPSPPFRKSGWSLNGKHFVWTTALKQS